MNITNENYSVIYDPETVTLTFRGIIRLYGKDGYADIEALLDKLTSMQPAVITLDFRELEMMNSPGMNVFSNFVLTLRKAQTTHLVIKATRQFPWQSKMFRNLHLLMPTLKVELE
jgi:hypothetical protein